MSDNEKNDHLDEEEYFFTEDGDGGSYDMDEHTSEAASPAPESAATKSKQSFSMPNLATLLNHLKPVLEVVKQNVIVRVSVIVAMVLLFAVVIYRCTAAPIVEKGSEKMTPVVATTSYPKSSIPVARSKHVILKKNLHSQTTVAQQETSPRFDKTQAELQAQVNTLSMQISSLTNNVNSMADNLRTVSNQLSQLAVTVGNETKLRNNLADQLKQIQMKKVVAREIDIKIPRLAQYYVQAMIPGRAWIVNSDGQTLTVSQGSPVADYGIVRYVDTSNGTVLTSSGRTITYAQADL